MECFWRRGYEATSVRDLADKMRISAPSLYNTYGDKHALYARALEHYLDQSARALIKQFEESLPPKQAVRRFLEEIIKHSVNDPKRRGCFLINSALEVAPHDRELRAFVADRFTEIEAFFYRSIKRAQSEGTVPAIARLKIWHGYCSAFCLAFGFSPAQSQKGPCSKASRGPRLLFSIEFSTGGPMIDLYYWTTPNGHKITIFLEEAGLAYEIVPVNISQGDQFKPEFLAISPNNRIPAIVDHEPKDGGKPISVFESGAILLYLAEKTGKFMRADLRRKVEVTQWLFWQMGGLGPMAGQNHHFSQYAPTKIPYAIDRYVSETNRLYGVLNRRLADRAFVAGEYSIADMATYPWIVPHERQGQNLQDFPHLKRWFESIKARPAVVRAYAKAKEINTQPTVTEESKRILFGQTAAAVAR